MFVGDINNGLLYRFVLNEDRNDLSFDSYYSGNTALLADKEVNDPKENQPFVLDQGFGGITDIEVGPDGFLYVLSYTGSLFRMVPSSSASSITTSNTVSNTNTNTEEQQNKQPEISDQSSSKNDDSIPVVILGLNGDHSYSPSPITIERVKQ